MNNSNTFCLFLVVILLIRIECNPLPTSSFQTDSKKGLKITSNGVIPTMITEESPEGCFAMLRSSCLGVYIQHSSGAKPKTCGTKKFYDCLVVTLSSNECRQSRLAMNIMTEFLHHFEVAYLMPGICPTDVEREEIEDLFSYNEEPFLHEDEEQYRTLVPSIGIKKSKEIPSKDLLSDEDESVPFEDQGFPSQNTPIIDNDGYVPIHHTWDTIDEETKEERHADEAFRETQVPDFEAKPDHNIKDIEEMSRKMEPFHGIKDSTVAPLKRTHPTQNQQIEAVEIYVDESAKLVGDKIAPWWKNIQGRSKKGFEPIVDRIGSPSIPMGRFNLGIHEKRDINHDYHG